MSHRPLLTVLGFAFVSIALHAQTTRNVPAQYPTVQSAINACVNGDNVLVAPGTYSGNLNFLGKAITVHSAQGSAVTTLQGLGSIRVVTFSANEGPNSVLDGFTVTGGVGGIACLNASPTITNCRVTGNIAPTLGPYGNGQGPTQTGAGGGIYCQATTANSSPTLSNCVVENNVAIIGGGVYMEASGTGTSLPFVSGCTLRNNLAYPSAYGYVSGSGGGAYINGASATFSNCTITDNISAQNGGGGVTVVGGAAVTFTLITCKVRGNHTNGTGGGLSLATQFTLTNCMVVDNSATQDGGAVYANGAGTIQATTLSGNTSAATAGGIVCVAGLSVVSSIVWGNSGIDILRDIYAPSASAQSVSYSDVGFVSGATFASGVITANPRFVDPANGDYHLAASSPCRNAGVPNASGYPTTDTDAGPRIVGPSIDMGGDEIPVLALPGSNEDVELYGYVNGGGDPLASSRAAAAGSIARLLMRSPGGSFIGTTPLVVGLLFPSNTPPAHPAGLPQVWVSGPIFVLHGALGAPPFTVPGLSSAGLTFDFAVPPGLGGQTVRFQALVVSPSALNSAFAVTNATDFIL